jgi:hypothetical protein
MNSTYETPDFNKIVILDLQQSETIEISLFERNKANLAA